MFREHPSNGNAFAGDRVEDRKDIGEPPKGPRKPIFRTLEPRMVFDAAAVVAIEHAVQAPIHHETTAQAGHSPTTGSGPSHLAEALDATPVTLTDKPQGTEPVFREQPSLGEAPKIDPSEKFAKVEGSPGSDDRPADEKTSSLPQGIGSARPQYTSETSAQVPIVTKPPCSEADHPDVHRIDHERVTALPHAVDTGAIDTVSGSARNEMFFVWDNVKNWQEIVANLGDGARVYVLDSSKDGVAQMAAILKGESDLGAIHLISHGTEGSLNLGTATLDADSIQDQYHQDLAAIGRSLSLDGDILIYGCDFGAGDAGRHAAAVLSMITNADIAASDDPTGAAAQGGDWDLEERTGSIEAQVYANYEYQSLLAPPIVDLDGALGSIGDFTVSYGERTPPVAIVADGPAGATIVDGDGDLQSITITADITPNGDAEHLSFGGLSVGMGSDSFNTVVVGTTTYGIAFTAATRTFVITNNAGGTIPSGGSTNTLIRSIAYDNSSADPTSGGESIDRIFTFTATDLLSVTSAPQTATVSIIAANDAPVAVDDVDTVVEDNAVAGNVLSNDTDVDGDALTVTQYDVDGTSYAVGQPANLSGVGVMQIDADGSYTFTPAANYDGPVPIVTYTVSDGNLNATATLTFTMTPVNDAPVDGDETNTVSEDTTLNVGNGMAGNLLNNATDIDGGVLAISEFSVAGESGSFVVGSAHTIAGVGDITINEDGSYVFVPVSNYTGPVPVITYRVSDGAGGTDSSTLSLSILPANDAPEGADNTVVITEDTFYTFSPESFGFTDPNDSPANAMLAVIITTLPSAADGVLLLSGVPVTAGQTIAMIDIPNLTFQPAENVEGTGVGAFTFQMVDDGGTVSGGQNTDQTPNTFSFDITPVNDAPVATDDAETTPEDTTLSASAASGLLFNDTDVDGDTLTITQFTVGSVAAAAGQTGTIPGVGELTINADGSYVFVPLANFKGLVPVATYTISDGHGGTDTATFTIEVVSVNDPPVDGDETNNVTEDTTLSVSDGATGDLLNNASDLDGDTLLITGFTVAGEAGPFIIGTGYLIDGVGTITINADGSYSFVPVANYDGAIPIITYTVSDGAGGSDTSTLTLAMTPVNDPPLAQDDAATTPENTPVSGNVLSNDTDVDDATLTVNYFEIDGQTYGAGTTATIIGVGTLTINADGSYVFTPAPSYDGPVPEAIYAVSDGEALDTAVLRITITPLNDAPVADDESNTTAEDTTLNVPAASGLLVGDVDADGDALTVTQFEVDGTSYAAGDTATIAGVGALTIYADGSYEFVPAADYYGPVPIATYTVSDGNGGADEGALTLTVTPVNDDPVAIDDTGTTPEDTTLTGNAIGNDTDVDGDQMTIVGFEVAGIPGAFSAGSTATITGVGTVTVNSDGTYTLVPAANYTGPVPTVTYVLSDGNGGTTTGTITLEVTPINDPPIATDDFGSTAQDSALSGNVLANDTDVEGDTLVVTGFVVDGTSYGPGDTATISGVGEITLESDGSYVFVPEPGYTGPVPDVTYTVSDGVDTDDGVLAIDVNPPNAVGANNDIATIPEDTTLTGNVLNNDLDPNGGTLSVVSFMVAGDVTVYNVGSTAVITGIGTLTVDANGGYVFVPVANYFGPVPVVTYTATDGTLSDRATLTITVTPVNDQPIAVDDTRVVTEDTTVTGNVLTNDTDIDGNPLSVTGFVVAGVNFASGQTANIPTIGRLTINADGSYTFTPVANYDGPVPVATYTLSDGNGGTDTAALSITITPVNDAPAAADDTATTSEDVTLTVPAPGLLSNDTDAEGASLTITEFAIAGVTGSFSAGSSATIVNVGELTINADGSYEFAPAVNYNGSVPIVTYTVTDGTLTDDATLAITVIPVNDAPVATDDLATLAEDTTLNVPATSGVLFNDTDVDGDTLSVTQFEVAGVVFGLGTTATIPGVGDLTIAADGSYMFTPVANYNGTVPTVTYTVSDGKGGTDTAVLKITVTPVNDAPVAVDDTGTVPEDTTLNGDVIPNDTDIDGDTLSVAEFGVAGDAASYPAGATAAISGVGQLTINSNGSYVFIPAADYNGPVPVVTYTVIDAHGGSDSAMLTIDITPVNDAPVAIDDAATTAEDTTLTVPAASGLLANDIDVDGDTMTIEGFSVSGIQGAFLAGATATLPGVGTLRIDADGGYVFVPVTNYNGPGPVATYLMSDGVVTVTAVLSITVTPVNDPPVDGDESNSVTEDMTLTVPAASGLLANTADIDGGTPIVIDFTIAGEAGPFTIGSGYLIAGVGTVTINSDGSYTFAPAANYIGSIPAVTYTVSDGAGGTDTSILTLTMVPVNDRPTVANDTGITQEDTILSGNVLTNDTDIDGDGLSVTQFTVAGDAAIYMAGDAATIAGVGVLTISADGSYTFVPAADYNGTVPAATYTASDGALTDTGRLGILVTPVNDAPVDGNETNTVVEDTALTVPANVGLLANSVDVDGGPPSIVGFSIAGEAGPFIVGSGYLITGVGTITINSDGSYSFVPAVDYDGAVPAITYTVSDGVGGADTSTLTLSIVPVNDPPVDGDETNSVPEDTTLTVPASSGLLANATDIDGGALSIVDFTVAGETGPFSLGTGYIIAGVGTVTVYADGGYSFTPVTNYTGGIPEIGYTVSDGAGGTDTSTLTLTIVRANDPPVAVDDAATTPEDTALNGNVLPNDTDIDGGILRVTQFVIGGATYTAGQSATITGVGSLTVNANGDYTFFPAANYYGPVPAATYTVSDGRGGFDTAILSIVVTPVNDAPDPDDGDGIDTDGNGDGDGDGTDIPNQTSTDGTSVSTVDTSGYFFDVDGDVLTYTATGLPAGLSIDTVTGVISGALPNDASRSSPYVVVVTATDPDGLSATQSFTWTVINPAPIANDDAATALEDTAVSGTLLGNDTDPDGDALAVTQFVFGGSIYNAGQTATLAGVGSLVINADGSYVFVPVLNYNGSVPAATYRLSDGNGGADTAILAITVTPVNDAPDIVNDQVSGNEDTTITGNVLENDSDIDGDTLSVTGFTVDGDPTAYLPGETAEISGVGSITIDSNGIFIFVPAPNYDGPVPGIVYTASDGNGGSGQATLIITIKPVDDFVPIPAEIPPELPRTPEYDFASIEVDGAVLDAVDHLGTLNRIADVAGRPADAPMILSLTTFLGGSSTIVIDVPGGDERIHVETTKQTGVIYLQIIEESRSASDRSNLSFGLKAADVTKPLDWLRQIGPYSFVAYPDAGAGTIELILSIEQSDGVTSDHRLLLETGSARLFQSSEVDDRGSHDLVVPMFADQMNERSRSYDAIEKALGFQP